MQFGGSLRFVELPAVAELLANATCTGRLRITQGDWTGDIVVRTGQIVAAALGAEHGRAALESIAIGLIDGDLSFADGPVGENGTPLVDAAERAAFLEGLRAERRQMAELIPSLELVPRLVHTPHGELADAEVTVSGAALQAMPVLAAGQTLDQLARERGLARTLREVAELLKAGLVRLDPPGSLNAQEPSPSPSALTEPPTSKEMHLPLVAAFSAPVMDAPLAKASVARRRASKAPGASASAHSNSQRSAAAPRARKSTAVLPTPASPPPSTPQAQAQSHAVEATPLPQAQAQAHVVEATPLKKAVRVAPVRQASAPKMLVQKIPATPAPERRRPAPSPPPGGVAAWWAALVRLFRPQANHPQRTPLFEPRTRFNSSNAAAHGHLTRELEAMLPG